MVPYNLFKKLIRPVFQQAVMLREPMWTEVEISGITIEVKQPTLAKRNEIKMLEAESSFLAAILSSINPSNTFWDVGAHHGIVSTLVACSVPSAEVVAVEPVAENIDALEETVSRNSVREQVDVIERVLADSPTKMLFEIKEKKTAGRHSLVGADTQNGDFVETTTGDTLVSEKGLKPPDVIKIDVEGAELLVLQGLSKSLRDCRAVFIELHPDNYSEWRYGTHEIEEYLSSHGLSVSRIDTDRGDAFMKAVR